MLVGPVWGRRKLEKAWRRMPADAKHGGALCKDWIRSWRFQGWSLRADLDEQQHHWWQKLMERFVLCFMAPWLWRMLQAHSMTCRSMDEEKEMERFGDNDVWIHGMEKTSRESMIMLTLIGIATLNLWLAVLPMRKRTDMAFNTEETYGQGLIVWQGSRRLPRHKHCVALWVWIRFWYGEACALAAESLQQLEQELTCWGSKEAWLPSPMSLRHLRISVFSGERRSQRWKARRATCLRHHHGCQSRRSPASWSSTARSRLTALNYMQLETCDLYWEHFAIRHFGWSWRRSKEQYLRRSPYHKDGFSLWSARDFYRWQTSSQPRTPQRPSSHPWSVTSLWGSWSMVGGGRRRRYF